MTKNINVVMGPGHTYKANGRPVPGVTTMIHEVLRAPELEEWFKFMGMAANAIRDEAAAFGSSVHAALALYTTGEGCFPACTEAWERTVRAGRDWIDANMEDIYATEEPVASLKYGYAGTPDLYGRRIGKKTPVIVDYKTTRDLYWSHRFQLAAYRTAAVETYGDKPAERIVLLFDKTEPGKVKAHVLQHHDNDFAGFGYILGLYGILKTGVKS
jgi:hypothetical protein